MGRKIRRRLLVILLLAAFLPACGVKKEYGADAAGEEPAQGTAKTEEAPEALNEYGLTDKQQEAFVRIYKKYQKKFMQDFMEKSKVEDPQELFRENLPTDERWAGLMVDLAEDGVYDLEGIQASVAQVEHYNKGYVFEHAAIEWMEEENISTETWKYLMDEHILGDMDFIENVVKPAYLEVYQELEGSYETRHPTKPSQPLRV